MSPDNRDPSFSHKNHFCPTSGNTMTFKYPSRIYRDYDDLLFFMGTPQSPRLTAEVRHNLIGRFLRFAEHLNDLRCYSICLPQGHRSTCWSLFEKTLLDTIPQQRPLGPLPLAQPKPPTKNPPPLKIFRSLILSDRANRNLCQNRTNPLKRKSITHNHLLGNLRLYVIALNNGLIS